MGKGEIAHYEQFLLFPQCFQKTCTAGFAWERVNMLTLVLLWVTFENRNVCLFLNLCMELANSLPNSSSLRALETPLITSIFSFTDKAF